MQKSITMKMTMVTIFKTGDGWWACNNSLEIKFSFMVRRGMRRSCPTQWQKQLLGALLPWTRQMYSCTRDNSLCEIQKLAELIRHMGWENAHPGMGRKGWDRLAINPTPAQHHTSGSEPPPSSSEEWRVWTSHLGASTSKVPPTGVMSSQNT